MLGRSHRKVSCRGIKLLSEFCVLFCIVTGLSACGSSSSGDKNKAPILSFDIPETILEETEITFRVEATDLDGRVDEYLWIQTTGPSVQFTDNTSAITFIVPSVDEDTPIGFLVQVADNTGAVAQAQLNSVIVNQSVVAQKANSAPSFIGLRTYKKHDRLVLSYEFDRSVEGLVTAKSFGECNGLFVLSNEQHKACLPSSEYRFEVASNQINFLIAGNASMYNEMFAISSPNLFADDLGFEPGFVEIKISEKQLLLERQYKGSSAKDYRSITLKNLNKEAVDLSGFVISAQGLNAINLEIEENAVFSLPDMKFGPNEKVILIDELSYLLWGINLSSNTKFQVIPKNQDSQYLFWRENGSLTLSRVKAEVKSVRTPVHNDLSQLKEFCVDNIKQVDTKRYVYDLVFYDSKNCH